MKAVRDHGDGEDNSGPLVAVIGIFLVLSTVSIALRSYTRAVLTKQFLLDDWFMLMGQAIFVTSCIFLLLGVRYGLGRHDAAIVNENYRIAALMWQALATATYVADMMFIKLGLGLFLIRLSIHMTYIWILRISLLIIAIWSSVIFLWDIFQCNPVAKQWDYRIEGGRCASGNQVVAAAYAISVMTIVSDWLFALLPIPMLWNVKMTRQAKLTVIAILGLGIFASVATLVRLRFLAALSETTDILFEGTDAMIWTVIEPGVAIIASSLATIRPLLRAMKVHGFESASYRSTSAKSASRRSSSHGRYTRRWSTARRNRVQLMEVGMNFEDKEVIKAQSSSSHTPDRQQTVTPPQAKSAFESKVGGHDVTNDVICTSPVGAIKTLDWSTKQSRLEHGSLSEEDEQGTKHLKA